MYKQPPKSHNNYLTQKIKYKTYLLQQTLHGETYKLLKTQKNEQQRTTMEIKLRYAIPLIKIIRHIKPMTYLIKILLMPKTRLFNN